MFGLEMFGQMPAGQPPGTDLPLPDTAETVRLSPLALLKMLRHCRAGVPLEVMGLLLGTIVDDYLIEVVDVFAMPQSGTGVSVEDIDSVFQTQMLGMLEQTERKEAVVGWYHSHPGFGCWLSSVDLATQESFEKMDKRAVAVVVDPIQSVRGRIVIDAFRTIPGHFPALQQEPRQTTSLTGHLTKPSLVSLLHGLNRHYYSLNIGYSLSAVEERLLSGLGGCEWSALLQRPEDERIKKITTLESLSKDSELYRQALALEEHLTPVERRERTVGRRNLRKHLERKADQLITTGVQSLLENLLSQQLFR